MYAFRTKAPSPESSIYHDAAAAKTMEMKAEPKIAQKNPPPDKGDI